MTRSELIKRLAKRHPGLQQKDIIRLVEIVFDKIAESMASGGRSELRGFGAFSVRKRKPRKARNPKTDAVVQLKERYSPYFRAGKELKLRINDGDISAI